MRAANSPTSREMGSATRDSRASSGVRLEASGLSDRCEVACQEPEVSGRALELPSDRGFFRRPPVFGIQHKIEEQVPDVPQGISGAGGSQPNEERLAKDAERLLFREGGGRWVRVARKAGYTSGLALARAWGTLLCSGQVRRKRARAPPGRLLGMRGCAPPFGGVSYSGIKGLGADRSANTQLGHHLHAVDIPSYTVNGPSYGDCFPSLGTSNSRESNIRPARPPGAGGPSAEATGWGTRG